MRIKLHELCELVEELLAFDLGKKDEVTADGCDINNRDQRAAATLL